MSTISDQEELKEVKMKKLKILPILMLVMIILPSLILTIPVTAYTPPDVINDYRVTISMDDNGVLEMRYDFDYTATTDFPDGGAYLEIGVPNRNFQILDYGPKNFVVEASANTGSQSQVRLEFDHLPTAGENFSFFFIIRQEKMMNIKDDQVTIQYTPGWFDFAEIRKLTIEWLFNDTSFLTYTDPEPKQQSSNSITWVTNDLEPDEKYTVQISIDKTYFSNSEKLEENQAEETGLSLGAWLLIIVVVFMVVCLFVSILYEVSEGGGYSSGSYIGSRGYRYLDDDDDYRSSGSSSYRSSIGRGSSGRSGGGSGGFSGRSSSCASCVSSCACACACAGGGRAGCNEKGFGVRYFLIRSEPKPSLQKKKKPETKLIAILLILIIAILILASCGSTTALEEKYKPEEGQPEFPKLEQYWVVDNGCGFDQETVVWADEILEKLRTDKIAEVVIVCQTGIQNNGPFNDEKIWILNWARWAEIGDVEDDRGVVWLIRPDVKPEDNRITITVSDWLTWYTAIDYGPTLEDAANFANYDNFTGALETIVSGTDYTLREIWKTKGE